MDTLATSEMAMRIGGALLCGALVGLERERKHRPAGFRTMILISLGSCGFVLLGIETVARVSDEAIKHWPPGQALPGQAEMSRVIQGLMGGIGFLGAGAVIQNKKAVRGLTTAAAVWVVSALGAACAFGFYKLALILGVATLFTLTVLDVVEERYFPEPDDWKSDKKNGKHGEGEGGSDAGYGAARLRGED
jgi:putative Mg2+ transporter-C (MgtC) family protein